MSHKLKYLKVVSSRYPSPQKWYWISVDKWEQYLLVWNPDVHLALFSERYAILDCGIKNSIQFFKHSVVLNQHIKLITLQDNFYLISSWFSANLFTV